MAPDAAHQGHAHHHQRATCQRGARVIFEGCKATGEVLLKRYRKRLERMLTSSFLFDTRVTEAS